MYCKKCGNLLTSKAKFCNKCGSPLEHEQKTNYTEQQQVNQKNCFVWKDKYSIGIIIAAIIIARGIGFGIKSQRLSDNQSIDKNEVISEQPEQQQISEQKEQNEQIESDTSNDAILDEQIEKEQTTDNKDFILQDSDSRYIAEWELYGLTEEQCRIARNEIYARHGRMFDDEQLQAYFNQFSWYTPLITPESFSETMLNDYEVANRDLIVLYEQQQGYR